ncbi:hypothetical protein ACHWQZ_G004792 [Mnemiopsis leidyi]
MDIIQAQKLVNIQMMCLLLRHHKELKEPGTSRSSMSIPRAATISRMTTIPQEKCDLAVEERSATLKKEKLKSALKKLERLKRESNLKMPMKVYSVNDSCKTVHVNQRQSAWEVCQVLTEKFLYRSGPDWTLVENITDQQIERQLEDHEIVYGVLSRWTADSTNRMYFRNNVRKYELFRRPQQYLPPNDPYVDVVDLSRESRDRIIEDFFSGSFKTKIPFVGLKAVHWLKSGRKSWRKMNFVINRSGVYCAPKSKNKLQSLSWICLSRREENDIYLPSNNREFKKHHSAPTEYCFVFRRKAGEQSHSSRVVCVESEAQFRLWTNALRRLEHGKKLLHNYNTSREWLERRSRKQSDLQRECPVSDLQSNFQFGQERASLVLPDIDDNVGDLLAERFGAAWNNGEEGEEGEEEEGDSVLEINLDTDTEGMTVLPQHT